MKNRINKWLVITACLVVCAIMAGLIGCGFARQPASDDPVTMPDTASVDVTVETEANLEMIRPVIQPDKTPVVVNPETPARNESVSAVKPAVHWGTAQTIQPDVAKPVYDEETLKDPSKTPDGKPVDGLPEHIDHDAVPPPPPERATGNSSGNSNGGNNSSGSGSSGGGSSGGLPGFDNVPYLGENIVTHLDGEGDINKMVGIMG